MSLSNCLSAAGELLHPEDRAAILARAKELRATGVSNADASKQAVREVLEKVSAMLKDEEGRAAALQPAKDLLGEAPNESQQAAAKIKGEAADTEKRQQNAAPDASGFKLTGSDRPADEGAARGQDGLFEDRTIEPWRVAIAPRLDAALRRWHAGKATEEELAASVRAELDARNARREEATTRDRVRGADWIRERLLRARRTGEMSEGEADLAYWLLDRAPHLARDLGISIREGDESTPNGQYSAAARLVTIFTSKSSVETTTHEILHHTERMMPAEVQAGIRKEWLSQLEKAAVDLRKTLEKKSPAPEGLKGWTHVETIPDAQDNAKRLVIMDWMLEAARKGDDMLALSLWKGGRHMTGLQDVIPYKLASPSEFWAVNGARLVHERAGAGGWVDHAAQWLKELVQKARGMLGLKSDAPVLKALDSIIAGDGSFKSKAMIAREAKGAESVKEESEAIFRRGRDSVSPESVERIQSIANKIAEKWTSTPKPEVVATYRDLPIESPPDTKGLYYQGKAYVVANRMGGERDIKREVGRVVAHEVIAHHGLRDMLGREDWYKLMSSINRAVEQGNVPLSKIRDEVRAAYVDKDGRYLLSKAREADEIAARAIEQAIDEHGNFRPGFGFIKAVYAKIAQFLREHGIDIAFTHAELQGMLRLAQSHLEAGERTQGRGHVLVTAAANRKDFNAPARMLAGVRSAIESPEQISSLRVAKQMAERGDDPDKVRLATGWFRGKYDSKWRYELSDHGADLTPAWQQLPESKLFGEQHATKLGEVLHHPELFKAYPEAKDITIVKRPGFFDFGGLQGWFNDKHNEIGITPYAKEPLSTLLHEVQHWIQGKEGFATGGNENMAFDVMTDAQKQAMASTILEGLDKRMQNDNREVEAKRKAADIVRMPEFKKMKQADDAFHESTNLEPSDPIRMRAYDATSAARKKLYEALGAEGGDYFKLDKTVQSAISWASTWRDLGRAKESIARDEEAAVKLQKLAAGVRSGSLDALKDAIKATGEGFALYRRIAGEIEARDTQARQTMTPEERQAKAPYSSEDIQPSDAIVTYGSGGEQRNFDESAQSRLPPKAPGGPMLEGLRDFTSNILREGQMFVAPMGAGAEKARAVAQTFANDMRAARSSWQRMDDYIAKHFTEEQRKAMWEAADEENVERQRSSDPAYKRPPAPA
jgi:hypothetical protein